jgi:hypothetical protein
MIPLAAWEEIIDASGAAPQIEAMLPAGVRARQLSIRTLLAGMRLAQADGRPARLTRVHRALTALPEDEQRRLGVTADWKNGPHLLTYRQIEYTFGLAADALGKDEPDGLPSPELQAVCDQLLEASVPGKFKDASASLAVDWTGLESFSRPPPRRTSDCADPEASWGHRKNNLLRSEDELFCGYYLSAGTMAREENGAAVPELARRAAVSSCRHDPVPAFTPVLTAMPAHGIPLGDVLADSGYSHRIPQHRAAPLRAAGAQLVQDLHPHDRGPRGTHDGAIISNGDLHCPKTPRPLLEPGPLAPGATREQAAAHDAKTAEAARCKPGRLTAEDADGCHRVQCPAAMGKIRCPLRPGVDETGPGPPGNPAAPRAPPGPLRTADHHRPAGRAGQDGTEARLPIGGLAALLRPPHRRRARLRRRQRPRHQRHQPRLVPPQGPRPADAAHHNPAHRPQPADPHPWNTRHAENQRRAAAGLPPETRKRRRKTLAGLAAGPP